MIEVCRATRPLNGGLIELKQLTELVTKRRGNAVDKVSSNDVLQVCLTAAPLKDSPRNRAGHTAPDVVADILFANAATAAGLS